MQVTSLGFGSVETKIHSINKSASVCFRKRKYQELSENARDILKKIKVDADKYVSGSKGIYFNLLIQKNAEQLLSFQILLRLKKMPNEEIV